MKNSPNLINFISGVVKRLTYKNGSSNIWVDKINFIIALRIATFWFVLTFYQIA